MRKTHDHDAGIIRARAEEELRARERQASPRTEIEAQRMVHELQVHQIELEIQKVELERTRDELEASLERYTDLYDFAPMGYFTLDRDGGIYSANLAGADLLGVPRARLLGRRFQSFVSPGTRPDFDGFLAKTLLGEPRGPCEVALVPDSGEPRIVRIEATSSPSGRECRAAVLDVTGQKAAEAELLRMGVGLEGAVRERAGQLQAASLELEGLLRSLPAGVRDPLRGVVERMGSLIGELRELSIDRVPR